jgi:hypothetical protein
MDKFSRLRSRIPQKPFHRDASWKNFGNICVKAKTPWCGKIKSAER